MSAGIPDPACESGYFAALEQSSTIVQVTNGVATTTSMRVANGTRNEHASVLRLIRDNLADFEEFGRVGFEIAPFDTAGGVQRREIAAPVDGSSITRMELIEIARNAELERLALEAENRELAPKAEAFDSFLDASGKYGVGAVAKMLGTSQNKLFRELRNRGVFIAKGAMRNTPYQQYMHHFEVIPHEYERSSGEIGCSYTTYVQPSGIDFIRRKLGLPTIDPLPATDAKAAS